MPSPNVNTAQSAPPDPSRPDPLNERIRSSVLQVLKDPLQWPDEMTTYLASFVALNAIQSTSS